jgi:hypothetical protein
VSFVEGHEFQGKVEAFFLISGQLSLRDGRSYVGCFNSREEMQGEGQLKFPDPVSRVFQGEMLENHHATGVTTYANGLKYASRFHVSLKSDKKFANACECEGTGEARAKGRFWPRFPNCELCAADLTRMQVYGNGEGVLEFPPDPSACPVVVLSPADPEFYQPRNKNEKNEPITGMKYLHGAKHPGSFQQRVAAQLAETKANAENAATSLCMQLTALGMWPSVPAIVELVKLPSATMNALFLARSIGGEARLDNAIATKLATSAQLLQALDMVCISSTRFLITNAQQHTTYVYTHTAHSLVCVANVIGQV